MVYKQKLTKIGNSVGLTLPKRLREELNFKLGKEVYLEQDPRKNALVITSKATNASTEVVDHDFYNLIKKVSNKYSTALRNLAQS